MTFADILNNFLNGRYPVPMMLLAVIVAVGIVMLFSRHMLGKLNIATKTDISQLSDGVNLKIGELRVDMNQKIDELRVDVREAKTDIIRLREDMNREIGSVNQKIGDLREEMHKEIGGLREEMHKEINGVNQKIGNLREETRHGFLQLKENDLYHTNKAILLMAKSLIPDENVYGRIKDSIMENTPDRLRADIREI
jgi:hypothetical protein